MDKKTKGLLERLNAGETVICAEGYIFAFERRGYLQAGPFVPMVILEHPHLVRNMYEEMVHAGSDVVQAFTYYVHRAKLALINKEDVLEKINRQALKMARQVAHETGTLMAGNICNSNLYHEDMTDKETEYIKDIFKEQVEWAVEEGADFIIAETMSFLGEAMLALDAVKTFGRGTPIFLAIT